MEPITLGLIVAGAAMIAVTKLSRDDKKSEETPRLGVPAGAVTELEKGVMYQVKIVTRSDNMKEAIKKQFGSASPSVAANIIQATFQQLGFQEVGEAFLDKGEAENWDAGKPAVWSIRGRWTLDRKYVDTGTNLPTWWGNAAFYKLPIV
jgi:hypothetical protein